MPSLLTLPDELLNLIIQRVAAHGRRRLVRLCYICRRLARLVQARLFNDIEIRGLFAICALANTARDRPDLMQKVERLHLVCCSTSTLRGATDSGSEGSSSEDGDEAVDRDVTTAVFSCGVRDLLLSSALPALATLSFRAFPYPVLLPVLSEAASRRLWPSLKALEITKCVTKDPSVGPVLWKSLRALPDLRELALGISSLSFPPGEAVSSLPHIQALAVRDLKRSPGQTPPLRDLLPNLRGLFFHGGGNRASLEHLLTTSPNTLRFLRTPHLPHGPLGLTRLLEQFPALECLHLGSEITESTDLRVLQASHIRDLAFSGEAKTSDDFLLDLVSGPNKMPDLRHLELNIPYRDGRRNALSSALGTELKRADAHTIVTLAEVARATHAPDWPVGRSPAGFAHVCEAAKRAGISVTGAALDCINWDDEFDAQLERYLVNRAAATDDMSLLVAYYGRDRATDVFRRRRPGVAALVTAGVA